MTTLQVAPLRHFLADFTRLVQEPHGQTETLAQGSRLLAELIRHDSWLPDEFAQPHPEHYQQYLLYADPLSRFSVVSFVWGPGQKTPVHDHRVWGLIGMLRGAEVSQNFARHPDGTLQPEGKPVTLLPGDVEKIAPDVLDIHQVSNVYSDRVSVSIHVYGDNIGAVARAVYLPDGTEKTFVSGYSASYLPNIWDLSKEKTHD
ncbi:cysteine dioxygenase [Rahnella bruchi]|uniref:cysteine dioxygenase family protein n=1 Tax=Rahnella bruchi TaxID=1510573 RepID=UPI000EA25B87|nr:cysteine dioxygenase [Rahnella bruchi]